MQNRVTQYLNSIRESKGCLGDTQQGDPLVHNDIRRIYIHVEACRPAEPSDVDTRAFSKILPRKIRARDIGGCCVRDRTLLSISRPTNHHTPRQPHTNAHEAEKAPIQLSQPSSKPGFSKLGAFGRCESSARFPTPGKGASRCAFTKGEDTSPRRNSRVRDGVGPGVRGKTPPRSLGQLGRLATTKFQVGLSFCCCHEINEDFVFSVVCTVGGYFHVSSLTFARSSEHAVVQREHSVFPG